MPTLNINGQRVTVDDSFLQLSPEQQNATVDEIAQSIGAQSQSSRREGVVLPISRDENGLKFDSDAGIVGGLKRAFTLPGEVMRGEVDLNTDEGFGRALEMGAVIQPGNVLTKGARVSPKPTAKQLKTVGGSQFDKMRQTGATYPREQVQQLGALITQELRKKGFNENVSRKTLNEVGKLQKLLTDGDPDITELDSIRQSLRKVSKNFNDPTNQEASIEALEYLERYIAGVGERAGIGSNLQAASKFLERGKANWGAGKRSELIGGMQSRAQRSANAANSGQNLGNSLRSKAGQALETPKKISGFNKVERAALDKVNTGSKAANITRASGNILGGGGGLGAFISGSGGAILGSFLGGPAGATAGALGFPALGGILKTASNKITEKALAQADDIIRARSPLYEEMLNSAPIRALPSSQKEQGIRLMLIELLGQQQNRSGLLQKQDKFNPQRNPNAA